MEPKKLAEKIIADIQEEKTTTTAILRNAKALGHLLQTKEFDWIENELNGYEKTHVTPEYRTINVLERKVYTGTISPALLNANSEWLNDTSWTETTLDHPISVLEGYANNGTFINTKTVLKTLEMGYIKKDIYQKLEIPAYEIKKILEILRDKVQTQIMDYLAKPSLSKPSLAIFSIYSELFPELSDDMKRITDYIETGADFMEAARTTRLILIVLANKLVTIEKPKKYVFADGINLTDFREKTKIKYYLENKGSKIFKNRKKLLDLDELYRDIYDLGSKASKTTTINTNQYEANFCVDGFITFLEKLFRYTDLKPI